MDYRQRRKQECLSLFAGFCPDFSKSRDPAKLVQVLRLASEGHYSHEIADLLQTTAKAVQKIYRRYNFPSLQNFAPPLRDQRQGWKGGIKEAKGYIYSRTPGHPYASKHGSYVAVHRLTVEASLGRYLLPTEVVDHIDGDTKNNSPENLRVFASNADHLRATLRGHCPDWSEDGMARLAHARKQPRRTWKGRNIAPIPAE